MKYLINFFIIGVLIIVVALTATFALLQVKRSQTIDDSLVSSLTTQLDTALLKKVIDKLK